MKKTSSLLSLFALLVAGGQATPKIAMADAEAPAEAVEAPPIVAPDPIDRPAPALAIHEVSAPPPADLKVDVSASAKGVVVRLRRPGALIMIRRDEARAVGVQQASISLSPEDAANARILWETTALGSLQTARGFVTLDSKRSGDGAPRAEIRAAEAPRVIARASQRLHTCEAHDDGAGGVSVVCRIDTPAVGAANLDGADPRRGVWVVPFFDEGSTVAEGSDKAMIRLEMPLSDGARSRVIGYSDGAKGIVLRAEATRVPGEDQPSFTILSAERSQPIAPRRRPWVDRWEEIDRF